MWSVWIEEAGPRLWPARLHIGRPTRRDPPLPGARWVRVRNRMAGIDAQDLALARGELHGTARLALPRLKRRYLGREVVGIVTEIGADVTLTRTGDRVVLQTEAVSTCATLGLQPPCRACAAWNTALCEHRTLPWAGVGSGWSDEMIVHESQVFLVPSSLSDDQAVLLEPAARAIRAVLQRLPEPGTEVLIIGGTAMGLLTLLALHAIAPGPRITLATDGTHAADAARKLGANAIISGAHKTMLEQGAAQTNSQTFQHGSETYIHGGFDVIFDCQGADDSIDAALRLTRSGGTLVLVSGPTRTTKLDISPLWHDEISVVGIAGPGAEQLPEDMAESVGVRSSSLALAARLMLKQRLKTDMIITHRFHAKEIRNALAIAARSTTNNVTRAVITFDS